MKSIDKVAIFFAILLVLASAVPALAGSSADDTGGTPLSAEVDTGNDSQLSNEPLSEQTDLGDDASGVDGGLPDQDVIPDIDDTPPASPGEDESLAEATMPVATDLPDPAGSDDASGVDGGLPDQDVMPDIDDTPPASPGEDESLAEATMPVATDLPDPAGSDDITPSEPGKVSLPTGSPEETPVPDSEPAVTEGPSLSDAPVENVTATDEVPPTSTPLDETPGADENATALLPADTVDLDTSTGTGVVENESATVGALSGDTPADESIPRMTVLCAWEQLDPAGSLLDDDPIRAGSQFLPPCAYGATKTIWIYAVVTGNGEMPGLVLADVISPDGSPFSRVNLTRQASGADALEAASTAGLITYAPGTDLNEAVRALEGNGAAVYVGELDLTFSQAPGDYHVSVQISSEEGEPVEQPLASIFTYLPAAAFEIDFATVDYGTVELGEDAWVEGDMDFGTTGRPTVRNAGNVPICITIVQDSMGLGVPVSYMAKLGSDGTPIAFEAMEEVTLPGVLPVNEVASISLALRVSSGGEGTPSGRLQISSIPYMGE